MQIVCSFCSFEFFSSPYFKFVNVSHLPEGIFLHDSIAMVAIADRTLFAAMEWVVWM